MDITANVSFSLYENNFHLQNQKYLQHSIQIKIKQQKVHQHHLKLLFHKVKQEIQ